ncbi:hypothetical protein FRB94_012115 [Tulasnella sp. JGI-2019a]|nr:hypothetical protein FRB94_012115 [Tulasnella sp. JGI-2019a]
MPVWMTRFPNGEDEAVVQPCPPAGRLAEIALAKAWLICSSLVVDNIRISMYMQWPFDELRLAC